MSSSGGSGSQSQISRSSGGGSTSSSSNGMSGSTPEQIIANYSKYLPEYLQQNLGQVSSYADTLNKTGLSSVTGAGGDTARNISSLTNETNPALSNATDAANTARNAAQNELNAINLNGLSPGEAAAVERSANQGNASTGNLGLLNANNTIANALNFGGAYNKKVGLYDTAVNTATNAANANTGAANATTGAQAGVNAIANPSQSALNASIANTGLLNQVAQGNFAKNSSASSGSTSSESMGWGAGGNSQSSAGVNCCFIFLEAYHGTMPRNVRRGRDKLYFRFPSIAVGYLKMAKWLVPLMHDYSIVRSLVWYAMIKPCSVTAEHATIGWNKTLAHFWIRTWAVYGKM